jgi:hypothetical protein
VLLHGFARIIQDMLQVNAAQQDLRWSMADAAALVYHEKEKLGDIFHKTR